MRSSAATGRARCCRHNSVSLALCAPEHEAIGCHQAQALLLCILVGRD